MHIGTCTWCEVLYRIDLQEGDDRDTGFCTACQVEKMFNHNKLSQKEVKLRDFQDKHIRRSWNKSAKDANARLIAKCNGVNYTNGH